MKLNNISIAGVILAGGLSTRMQQDKKFLKYKDKTFLDIATTNLTKAGCSSVFLSLANKPNFATSLEIIEDKLKNIGAISGVLEALNSNIKEDYIIFLPVDMPLLSYKIIKNLIINISNTSFGFSYENNIFPFIIKNSKEVLNILQYLVSKNCYSLKKFLLELNTFIVPYKESENYLQNINYYEQFLKLNNVK